jgi:hypothetical protein
MNTLVINTLKVCRKIYAKCTGLKPFTKPRCEQDANIAAKFIYNALIADKLARFGSTELTCLANYIGITQHQNKFVEYIKRESGPWWWGPSIISQRQQWSGLSSRKSQHILLEALVY